MYYNTTEGLPENMGMLNKPIKIAFLIIGIIGILGNSTAVYVTSKKTMRRTSANLLIWNQSLIDLMVSSLIIVMMTTWKSDFVGNDGYAKCIFWVSDLPFWSLVQASSFNLALLCFERYMAVVHPIMHRNRLKRKYIILMAVMVWICGLAIQLCFMLPSTRVIRGKCVDWDVFPSHNARRVFGVAISFVEFWVPMLFLVVFYVLIFVSVNSRVSPVESQAESISNQNSQTRAKRNVVKTVVVVVLCYIGCNSLRTLYTLSYNLGAKIPPSGTIYQIGSVMNFSNCCVNPFVYTFQYRAYQVELRKIFCAPRKKDDESNIWTLNLTTKL